MSARRNPGLRCGSSRHDSVVRTAPCPFVSIEPPSSTIAGSNRRSPNRLAIWRGTSLSRSHRGVLAAPRVELPVDDRHFAGARPAKECRTIVPGPCVIGRDVVQHDLIQLPNHPACLLHDRLAAGEHVHRFETRECFDDERESMWDRLKVARPRAQTVRPRDPRRAVRLPFGRPAATERTGCVGRVH
jgi:hypothetical protein